MYSSAVATVQLRDAHTTATLMTSERGRRWKVSTRHKTKTSLAGARIGRLQSASSRSGPCHVNLVYRHAVLSLGVHATCAPRKVRPQGDILLPSRRAHAFACLARINPMRWLFYEAAE